MTERDFPIIKTISEEICHTIIIIILLLFDLYNLQLDAFIRLRSLETATYSLYDPVDELFSGGGVVWSAARQVTICYEFLKNQNTAHEMKHPHHKKHPDMSVLYGTDL